MKSQDMFIIKCPKCNAEYLPAEIYFPKDFFGNPEQIIRDSQNQILNYTGTGMNFLETYRCNYCDVIFKVTAKINFNTAIQTDYDTTYSTSLKKNTLFLPED